MLLVGDSAGSVILGHPSTVATPLEFQIEITAAVKRGAPNALVMGDMPFGSYHESVAQGVHNTVRMVQLSGCDCVKFEVAESQRELFKALADAGVACVAHVGLRPQQVGLLGGYRFQGRTVREATMIVDLACRMEESGASAILVEATPPEVAERIVAKTGVPVIGCGAGPACHAQVVVLQDLLRLTPQQPKFVPNVGEIAPAMKSLAGKYVQQVADGSFPSPQHTYSMPPDEKAKWIL
jgi:3-methyl-2-oxobutanoate hydroxymethyltransferase